MFKSLLMSLAISIRFTLRTSWSCFNTAWTSSLSNQLNSSSYQEGEIII